MTTLLNNIQSFANRVSTSGTAANNAISRALAPQLKAAPQSSIEAFTDTFVSTTRTGARKGIAALAFLDKPVGALPATPNCPPGIHQVRNLVAQGVAMGLAGAKVVTGAIGALMGAAVGFVKGAVSFRNFQKPVLEKTVSDVAEGAKDAATQSAAAVDSAASDIKAESKNFATELKKVA